MPKRIVKLLIVLLVVALVCYVFYLNPHRVPVNYSPSGTVEPPLALTLIGVFCAGAALTALLAMVFDMEYMLRLWHLARRERQNQSHRSLVVSAREQLAAGMLVSARDRLHRILQKDPGNTVARIELAQTFLNEDKPQDALRIIDEARSEDKENIELLFLAAEVNHVLGNLTGAYDNLQLIRRREPRSPKALSGLVTCCCGLERYEEALQYQVQLLRGTRGTEQTKLQEELADIEVCAVQQRFAEPNREYRRAIEDILVRHRDFPPALRLLAALERDALKIDAAGKLLLRSFRASRSVEDLELLADLWLQAEEPARAIAAVRAAVQTDEGSNPVDRRQLESRMFLVALLIFLENLDEAKGERKKIDAGAAAKHGLSFGLEIIDSWLHHREGETEAAYQQLFQSLAEDSRLPGYTLFSTKGTKQGLADHWTARLKSRRAIEWQPAPELSTP